ncbi:EFR1 family ferrodoxin [Proteiniclasticum sp. C24MP]|uniref:EFR1 family ferrodoxin n=1 Tax=Proteiniclasticum sp. C24MP TaxID=3374101 RepID=UPI003754350A
MIFYFSGTGNSLYVAEKIRNKIGSRVIDISKAMTENQFKYELDAKESVGFVFPAYYYGLPTIVADFISKLDLTDTNPVHIFAVVTCGANCGGADRLLNTLLKGKNLHLSAFYELPMVDNFIFGYDLLSRQEQEDALKNAEGKLMGIIKSISVKGTSDKPSTFLERMLTGAIYPIYQRGRKTRKFYADNRCNSCNLCEEICPSKAIKMVNGRPEWTKEQCIHCVACINRCPQEAIQYGQSTKKRNRYVHPILK